MPAQKIETGPQDAVHDVSMDYYGKRLATASSDTTIKIIGMRNKPEEWIQAHIVTEHKSVNSIAWAPHELGLCLACGSSDGQFNTVQKIVYGGCDNTVKVWKLDNGGWRLEWFPALHMHSDWVRDVAWARNLGLPKSTIASASQDGTVVIWTVAKEGDQWEGKVLCDFKTPVWRVSWSLTGNIMAVADGNNNATLWKEAGLVGRKFLLFFLVFAAISLRA
ncbi:uncharacterized protein A4U43_C01F3620 [Asparagus officinalis]|uniref:Uncharacterized protein n=1 Tax=Asparagus officinalis TaxID=4686 RepID=A0A5P1FLR2_ASPOF|nr:uncharacterized protein A4U43_C01F3620 [Asparagus officinalis]